MQVSDRTDAIEKAARGLCDHDYHGVDCCAGTMAEHMAELRAALQLPVPADAPPRSCWVDSALAEKALARDLPYPATVAERELWKMGFARGAAMAEAAKTPEAAKAWAVRNWICDCPYCRPERGDPRCRSKL